MSAMAVVELMPCKIPSQTNRHESKILGYAVMLSDEGGGAAENTGLHE